MSIYCYMKTDRYLVAEDVEADLKHIIKDRLQNLLELKAYIGKNQQYQWNIGFNDVYSFNMTLQSHNSLAFEHPDCPWALWAQSIIEQDLSLKYGAQCVDEEYPVIKTNVLLKQHNSFQEFLEDLFRCHSSQWKKAIVAIELSHLPEELKKISL